MGRSLESLFDRYRRHGDAAALATVYDRTAPELLRIAMHLARNTTLAEELVQETFLTAIEQRSRYDTARPLVPWLTGILGNLARRARRAATRVPDPARLPGRDAAQAHARGSAWGGEIAKVVRRLREPYREVVTLHLRFGMSPSAIAEATNRAPGTVRAQLHRGLGKLRERMPPRQRLALVPLLGAPGGLGAIRERILVQAERAASDTATSSTLAIGGLLVSKTQLLIVVAAALVLLVRLGIGAWNAPPPGSDGRPAGAPLEADADVHALEGDTPILAGRADEADVERLVADVEKDGDGQGGWQLMGTVRDARTQRPVPGATIRVALYRGEGIEPYEGATSDDAGRYVIALGDLATCDELERRTTRLVLRTSAPGYVGGQAAIAQLPGDTTRPIDMDLEVLPGVRITGRVVDASFEPVVGGAVVLYSTNGATPDAYEVTTDEEGGYTTGVFASPDAALSFVLVAKGDGGYAISKPFRVADAEPIEMPDLKLAAVGVIEGVVVRPDGRPVPGVSVHASHPEGEVDGDALPYMLVFHRTATTTRSDGTFTLPVHREGPTTVQVRDVAGSYHAASRAVEAGARDVRIVADVRRIDAWVADPDGEPAIGVPVRFLGIRDDAAARLEALAQGRVTVQDIESRQDLHAEATTGEDGITSVWVPAGSAFYVVAGPPGMIPSDGFARAPKHRTAATLDLGRPRPLRGPAAMTVQLLEHRDGRAEAVFPLDVTLQTSRGVDIRSWRPLTSSRITNLPEGTFRIRVAPMPSASVGRDASAVLTRDVTLVGAETCEITLELGR